MDKVLENIKQRRSIRSFKSEPVKEEYINKIIEAGLSAPSGLNRQAGKYTGIWTDTVKYRWVDS